MKWDDKQYINHDPIAPGVPYLSNPPPYGENEVFYLVPTGFHPDPAHCAECAKPIRVTDSTLFWIGQGHLLCWPCGCHLRNPPSRGSTHRCIECSLVRCGAPNSRCEECVGNMS